MTNTNTIAAIRRQLVLLGSELAFASGIRAVAAEQLMEGAVSDPYILFDSLENTICNAQLFESYQVPLNSEKGELVLGRGIPYPSLETYVTLHAHYGSEWLKLAMTEYCAHIGSVELRSNPEQFAQIFIKRAQDNFDRADKPLPGEPSVKQFSKYQPAASDGGEHFLVDITVGPIWNGLMLLDDDGYGPLRVVSAWKAFCDGCDQADAYNRWDEVVADCVKDDLGASIAATYECMAIGGPRSYWSFAILYQALGEEWPIKALEFRLRMIENYSQEDAAAFAKAVWQRGLTIYANHKKEVAQSVEPAAA